METIEAARRAPFADNPRVGELGTRTQQRIVSAAMEVFADRGYDASLVKHITTAAGCSRPTFYQYFASKEDLFRKVTGQVALDIMALLERPGTVDASAEGHAALHRLLIELGRYYEQHPVVFSTFGQAARTDDRLASGSLMVSGRFARAFLRQIVDPPQSWDLVHAGVTISMIMRCLVLQHRSGTHLSPARYTESLASLVHRAMFGPIEGINTGPVRKAPRAMAVEAEPDDGLQGRHEGLVSAGRRSFARLGRHATRVDDIVELAGVSHGTFYRYFRNKDELYGLLLADTVRSLTELASRFPAAGRPEDRRAWLTEWSAAFGEHGALLAGWKDADLADPFVAGRAHLVAGPIVSALRRQLAVRGFGDVDGDAVTLLALAQREPVLTNAAHPDDRARSFEASLDLIERAFIAPGA